MGRAKLFAANENFEGFRRP